MKWFSHAFVEFFLSVCSSLSIPQEAEVALTNCHMLTMSQSISLMHTVLMPARVQNFTTKPHLCKTVLKVLICTGLGIHLCDAAGDIEGLVMRVLRNR